MRLKIVKIFRGMGERGTRNGKRIAWILVGILIVLLAFQGHHLAHLLLRAEGWIENLGPWGSVIFITAIFVLEPTRPRILLHAFLIDSEES